jgi:hypothetical protein
LNLLLAFLLTYNAFQLYEGFKSFKTYSQDVTDRINEMLADNNSGAFRYIRKGNVEDTKWTFGEGLTSLFQQIGLCEKYKLDWISVGSRFSFQLKPEQFDLQIQISRLSPMDETFLQRIKTGTSSLLCSHAAINVLSVNHRGHIYVKESFYDQKDYQVETRRLNSLLKNLQKGSLTIITISKNAKYNNILTWLPVNIHKNNNLSKESIVRDHHQILLLYKSRQATDYIKIPLEDRRVYTLKLDKKFFDSSFWEDLEKKNISRKIIFKTE